MLGTSKATASSRCVVCPRAARMLEPMVSAICLAGCLDIVCIFLAQMTARHKMPMTKATTDRVALLRFQAQMADTARKVGARIRELRLERLAADPRWTQDYLARQVEEHMNGTQMSRYERGENMPGEKRLERIAEVLETQVADLYAGPMSERDETEGADLMDALGTPKAATGGQAEELTDTVLAQMNEGFDRLFREIGELRQLLESDARTRRGSRS